MSSFISTILFFFLLAFDPINASPFAGVPEVLRPPKRPPTAFVLFYNRAYPSPGSRPGGITATSKEAGEAWHKLPDIEKQVCRANYFLYVQTDRCDIWTDFQR